MNECNTRSTTTNERTNVSIYLFYSIYPTIDRSIDPRVRPSVVD